MSETQVHRSDTHASTILKGLDRLRKDHIFCDVQLQVGPQLFQAHRLVLSACSPYFDALLTSGLSETHQDVINIQGVQPNIFEHLLEFIYTGHLDVTTSNAQGLLFAADMFQLNEIKQISASFLKLQLHSSNCLGFLRFSQALSCPELSTASRAYIHSKISEVKGEEEFFDLDVETLIEILQSEDLRVDNEYEVFEAAMNWISHDPPNRRKHLVRVLEPVRIPIIQPAQLFKYVEECKDLSLRIATGKLLQDYHPRRKSQASTKVSHAKSLLPSKYYQPRKSSRKRLLVMGGYCIKNSEGWSGWGNTTTLSDVELYDSFDQTWHPFPAMQQPRSGFGAAVLGGTVYAIGGEHESLLSQNVEKYDAVENCWTKMSPLLCPRSSHGVCVVENKIYVFGGWVGLEMGADIERCDPDDDVWTVHDRLASLRSNFGVVSHEGLVYLAGGASDTGTELRLVESYNPVIKEWTQLASMRTRRSQCAMAVLDDALYVVGGYNSSKNVLSSVERYSLLEDKWMKVKSMIMPRACAGVAVAHGKLYVVGGKGSSRPNTAPPTLDTMECYDPETDIWIDLGRMTVGRCEAAVAVL
ncbi:actin-binding protein IPP-like [Strongylocentrotus purpuratus]|uniref:BTB domain-containing protein n=1 Tax=Strongylocentrotus purpuratus TaxID=7668 RepID=A0A7M7PKY8_STRPU|nr:actin-binding protein IPP-like [Strongylocentrotus purpuratus]